MFILQSVLSYNESIGGLLINLLCGEQTRKSSLEESNRALEV